MKRRSPVFIIAEAGVNHNGSLEMAKKMIDVAAYAQVDAVKFQTFVADRLVTKNTAKANYQKKQTDPDESQFEMLKKLELNKSAHLELLNYCQGKELQFLSTPFDSESVNLLNEIGMKIFKIPSGEITNYPYLKKIGRLKKKIILSTGMATLGEIEGALHVLEKNGTKRSKVTLLHCNTAYPTPIEDVNLRAMKTIRRAFNVEVGYSDHTEGVAIPIAAVSLGAVIIEKHYTLDKTLPGPDHKGALDPEELKIMVESIRAVEGAMGSSLKGPTRSEILNADVVRKSIVASQTIKKGDIFSEENVTAKRPGTGMCPMRWQEVIGNVAGRIFLKDELIEL